MTIANPLVKRCYTMSEPHLSGHRVILGFNTMKEAQDAHDFIANIRPSPADSPCQSAGAVAPGECGSVPDERAKFEAWSGNRLSGNDKFFAWEAWQARAALQLPNNQPNSDHVAVISAKPDSVHLAGGKTGVIPGCGCEKCRPITLDDMRMILCSICGNKRCPHATDHGYACTGSNEPGQLGSAYAESGINPKSCRPNEKDVVGEGKQ